MDKLQEKYTQLITKQNELSVRLIRFQTQNESIQRDLASAKAEAKQKFGTDDLDKLRSIYKQQAENGQKELVTFENSLNQLEANLNAIDEKLRATNV